MKLILLFVSLFALSNNLQAAEITLAPGSEIKIEASESSVVRCEGTSVSNGCVCVVGDSDDNEFIGCSATYNQVGYVLLSDGVAVDSRGCWSKNTSGNASALSACRSKKQSSSFCN